jgi:hypothetical protein
MLLPFERIHIRSARSADDLIDALARVTAPPPPLELRPRFLPPVTSTFTGQVSKERVYIRRAFNYRNSFAPFLSAKIIDAPAGARIDGMLRPHVAVLIFLALYLWFLAPYVFAVITGYLERGRFEELDWIPLAMVVAVYAMCMIGYVPEARRLKRLLREIAGPDLTALQPH